nr:glycosyltransferase family 2 protein [uncultured Pseudodesulfovibrio sp.]
MKNKKFSVVIPVYNSAKVVSLTVERVRAFFLKHDFSFEIILVNDGSPDSSWDVISELAQKHEEVIAINLLKNYGQHNANLCGFRASCGDYLITMDDDLQNPPEEIIKLIETIEQGYDLVIGKFEKKEHSLFRSLGSKTIGHIIRKVFRVKDNLILSNFRIIRRDVVDRVCEDTSVTPYIPGLVLLYSVNRCNVLVKHNAREYGTSNYNLVKLARLVMTILFSHSTIPLRYAAGFGFIASIIIFCLGLFYLINAISSGSGVPGWPTLIVLLSFFSTITITLLSIIGEYIIRLLRETHSSQSYIITKIVGKK